MTLRDHYYPGESVQFLLSDLLDVTAGAISSGAVVTFSIRTLSGTILTSATGTAITDDWSAYLTIPTDPGHYREQVTAVYSGATLIGQAPLDVLPLTALEGGTSYTTVEAIKSRYDDRTSASDMVLEVLIAAASRQIDGMTNRFFYQTTGETRYFTACEANWLPITDLVTLTSIATDGVGDRLYSTAWSAADYDLEPFDAALKGFPYTEIQTSPNGNQWFTGMRKGVKIVGDWGWPSVPPAIQEATILQTIRLAKRIDSPFGISGSADLGQMTMIGKVDPDVGMLIAPFRRFDVLAVR